MSQVNGQSVRNPRTLDSNTTIQSIIDNPLTLDGDTIFVDASAGYSPEASVTVSKKLVIIALNGTPIMTSFTFSNKPVVVSNFNVYNVNVQSGGSLQDAITTVATAGTVNVSTGIYPESIVLSKALTITGTGKPVLTKFTLTNQSVVLSGIKATTVDVQSGAKLQDGANLVDSAGTVNVAAGTYAETVTVSEAMKIVGTPVTNVNSFVLKDKKVTISNVVVNTVDVQPNGSIQDGINAVAASGTVNVSSGTYSENINLIKGVSVIGTGNPNVRGIQYTDPTATITGFNAPDSIYVRNASQLQLAIDAVKESGTVFIDSNYYAGKYFVKDKTIKFNSYGGKKSPVVQSMTIDNHKGNVVTMLGEVDIEDTLDMVYGMITTSGKNTFKLLDSAEVIFPNHDIVDDSTFINGTLMKESKTVATRKFLFPVGKIKLGRRLLELDITQTANPPQDSVVYTVAYRTDGNTQISTIPNQPFHPAWYPPTYWFVDNGGYKFFDKPKVTLHFRSNDVPFHLVNDSLGYGVGKTQGPNWADLKQSTSTKPFLDTVGIISSKEVFKSFGDIPVTFMAIGAYNKCTALNVQPEANFTFSNICENSSATFTNISSIKRGSIVMFKWEVFDDTVGVTSDPVLNGYYTRIDTGHFVSPVNNPGKPLTHKFTNVGTYKVRLTAMSDTGCYQTIEQNIKVFPVPVMTFSSSPEGICNNTTATFKVNVASVPTNETWTFGYSVTGTTAPVAAQTVTGKGSGAFTFTTPVLNGATKATITLNTITNATINSAPACSTISNATQDIMLVPKPTFTAPTVCIGTESIFANTTSAATSKSPTYLWNFADSTSATGSVQKHTYKKAGTFNAKLIVNSGNGCVDSVSQNVIVNPLPVVVFTPASPILPSVGTTPVSVTASSAYVWNTGANTQVLNADTAGTYSVKITDANGCQNTGSVFVKAYKPSFTAPAVCVGKEMIFTNTTSTANTKFPSYFWDYGDSSSAFGAVTKHTYKKPGSYKVILIVNSGNGRVDSTSQFVTIYSLPVNVFNPTEPYCAKGSNVEVSTTAGMTSYLWKVVDATRDLVDSTKQTIKVFGPGKYSSTIVDVNTCLKTDTLVVLEEAIIIANTLTPNGDDYNDTWWIDKIAAHPDCKVTITNRYGEEVFSTTNYQNDWGGTYKGSLLPDGAYYYVITCDSIEKVYKGHVNILKGK